MSIYGVPTSHRTADTTYFEPVPEKQGMWFEKATHDFYTNPRVTPEFFIELSKAEEGSVKEIYCHVLAMVSNFYDVHWDNYHVQHDEIKFRDEELGEYHAVREALETLSIDIRKILRIESQECDDSLDLKIKKHRNGKIDRSAEKHIQK